MDTFSVGGQPVTRREGLLRFKEDAAYWWGDNGSIVFWVLGVVVIGYIVAVASLKESKEKAAHEAAFMAECQQDKKHYECEAMWRAGEDHEHMIPVVIPMPSGR